MKKQTIAALACVTGITLSFLAGIMVSKDYSAKKPMQVQGDTMDSEDLDMDSEPAAALPDIPVTVSDRITPSTKMTYEYYYTGDGIIEKSEELPPYFLIDKTKEDMQDLFSEWIITSFTPDEVIMRKYLSGNSSQYYIVGVHEGFIAVFYAKEINGSTLKEVTDTPLAALPGDEQERLKSGIHVLGQDALVKVLEDYSS